MKKNWKKVLSLILALSMVFSMNTAVFATEPANPESTPAAEEATGAVEAQEAEAPAEEAAKAAAEPAAEEAAEKAEAPAAEEVAEEPAKEATPAAKAEEEDAAEGAESPANLIENGSKFNGVRVWYERHGSVVSDNNGNLTVSDKGIVLLDGAATKGMTITLGKDAEVYVGQTIPDQHDYWSAFGKDNTDRDKLEHGADGDAVKNVLFDGSGTVYLFDKVTEADSVSVNTGVTVDVTAYAAHHSVALSGNGVHKFYISKNNAEYANYKEKSFTGLSGKLEINDMEEVEDLLGAAAPALAKEVSASAYTVSVNSGISVYKDGAFKAPTTAVTGMTVGEGKDFEFGQAVIYKSGTSFKFTIMGKKSEKPDVSAVVGNGGALMESAWRMNGIDLDEAVAHALKYLGLLDGNEYIYSDFGSLDEDIQFVISEKNELPAADAKGWDKYETDSHKVCKKLVDGKLVSANKTYYLFARNASDASINADNVNFFSDAVYVGYFETKETPASANGIEIPASATMTYMGDTKDAYAEANSPFLQKNFLDGIKFKDKDGTETKKLKADKDIAAGLDGFKKRQFKVGDEYKDGVGLAVKIDGSTVGVLKNYIVEADGTVSAEDLKTMSEKDIAAKSNTLLDTKLRDMKGDIKTDIRYLSANTYYVKTFFEAYKDQEYTGNGPNIGGDKDLPYNTASSNVMTLTVKPAKIKVVPDLSPLNSMTYDDKTMYGASYNSEEHEYYNNWYSFSKDSKISTTSGNKLSLALYAFDSEEDRETPIVSEALNENDYFDMVDNRLTKYKGNGKVNQVIDGGIVVWGDKNLSVSAGGLVIDQDPEKDKSIEVSANGKESRTITVKVSANSLKWTGAYKNVSMNFTIEAYPEYTIVVNPVEEGGSYGYSFVGFGGRAWYGSTLEAVTRRVYYDYKWKDNKSGEEGTYKRRISWQPDDPESTSVSGSGVYYDEACTKKVSSDELMADVEAGKTVYVSVNRVEVISDNNTSMEYKVLKGQVIPVLIEPRPIDVYAHAYPYRGEAFNGKMDPSEIYGDITDIKNIVEYDSTGWKYGFDEYYYKKKSAFQGKDLVASTDVSAKNANLVDTTEATIKWIDNWYEDEGEGTYYTVLKDGSRKYIGNVETDQYIDDPYKVYLDLPSGFAEGGCDKLSAALAKNFYINTAVGYVTVQPKYSITYMLQYEDKRKDGGQAKDKLVATETVSFDKTKIYDGLTVPQRMVLDPVNGGAKDVIKTWTAKGDGVLNAEDGDAITSWKYMKAGDDDFDVLGGGAYDDGQLVYDDNDGLGDYFVTAVVSAYAGSNVYVESIEPVFYTGLNHVANYAAMNNDNYNRPKVKSTEVNDLPVIVKIGPANADARLVYGKDYTISYKNNKDASVYFVDDGKTSIADKVKPVHKDKKKKPQVIIKGAGKYKGKFSATVNFDIYPVHIEGDGGYIESIPGYYRGAPGKNTINGIKDTYFGNAANGKKKAKAAKVNYKVQNVQYPSKLVLNEWAHTRNPSYDIERDENKPKIATLKKNKDYVEIIERWDETDDKNIHHMGWIPVTAKEIVPKANGSYKYKITVKGKGNYTGTVKSIEFTVYDSGYNYYDISKLKITTPKTINWEKLMLNKDNTVKDHVDLADLGIKVESKKNKKVLSSFSGAPTYSIYKVDKAGKVEETVVWENHLNSDEDYGWLSTFNDAGTYKIVLKGYFSESVKGKKKGKEVITTNRYRGTVEKNFTIKGITLKKGDFKLDWTSKKWNGSSDPQSLKFSPGTANKIAKNKFGKNTINQTYVEAYLKNDGGNATYDPFWNATDKRFEAYIRDYVLQHDNHGQEDKNGDPIWDEDTTKIVDAAKSLAQWKSNIGAGVYGDVYYTDNGMDWKVGKQLDVYRFVFENGSKNKDVGTYTITIQPDGIFGTDELKITYKRTGTATKVLDVE